MKPRALIFAAGLLGALLTPATAQMFIGSDNFNAAGPAFNTAVWNVNGQSYLTQTNGHAAFNTGAQSNVDGLLMWPTNANFDASSHSYDWSATVSATLDFTGAGGFPFLGIYAKPAEGGYFGIMLRGDQNSALTSVFSSYSTNGNVAFSSVASGSVFTAYSTTTSDISDVLLRLSWNSSAGTLTSFYSYDGGTNFSTAASINVSSGLGFAPANGFYISLYAASGGATHPADSMYFDNFAVTSAIPEPSTYAALAGLGALGLAFWRRRQKAAAAA